MNLRPDKSSFTPDEHATLRAEVKGMVNPRLTQADIGRQAEIPSATLSQYLNDKYPGDNDAIATQVNKWLLAQKRAAEHQDRLPVSPLFQPLDQSAEIMLRLGYARRAGRVVSICGAPGTAKTSTAMQFRHENPRTWLATMDPSTSGVNTCLVEILAAMGEPDAKGTPQGLSRRISQRAQEAESLIIIDEAQHLSDKSIEQLRGINDKARAQGAKVGIVMMGNQLSYSRMAHDGSRPAFAQVSSRMAQRMWLVSPLPRDVAAYAEAYAAANDEVLTRAALAYCQTIAQKPGGLRNVEMSMEGALMAAWGMGHALDAEHLTWAFGQLSGQAMAA